MIQSMEKVIFNVHEDYAIRCRQTELKCNANAFKLHGCIKIS